MKTFTILFCSLLLNTAAFAQLPGTCHLMPAPSQHSLICFDPNGTRVYEFASALPEVPPAPVVVPVVPAVPVQAPAPLAIDYTALLRQILDSQQQLLVVAKDTQQQLAQVNKTVGQVVGPVAEFLAKYVAPAVTTFLVTRRLMQ